MTRRLARAILLLYPRPIRHGYGPEILALLDELITYERRSRVGLFFRLAIDGLAQRIASTATAWTVAAILAATSLGSLAVSDFASASAHQRMQPTAHTVAPASHAQHRLRTRRASARANRADSLQRSIPAR